MAPDFSAAAPISAPASSTEAGAEPSSPPSGARDKVRLRFRKDGSLRWLSHHDLLRTFERMLRRSGLPFRSTQGFHPHPRIVFALSLPLGVIGAAEIVELELNEEIEPAKVRERLSVQCPPGLAILDARRIAPNSGVHVRGLCYGMSVPTERREAAQKRIAEVLSGGPCWVERSKPAPRRLDIRPFLRDLRLNTATGFLEMDLWLLPNGTARPDEVLAILELEDLLEAGSVLERVRLQLHDENPPDGPAPSEQSHLSPGLNE
jgi:radical SAM-linked protein